MERDEVAEPTVGSDGRLLPGCLPVEWGCSVGGYCQWSGGAVMGGYCQAVSLWSGGAVWDLFSDVSGQVLDVQSQRRLASRVVVEHTHIPHLCGGREI